MACTQDHDASYWLDGATLVENLTDRDWVVIVDLDDGSLRVSLVTRKALYQDN